MHASRRDCHPLLWYIITVFIGVLLADAFAAGLEDIPPPRGKYDEQTLCVEPVEIMRRKHFDFILDHRDETVIRGVRTKQYSLKGCIDCHITPDVHGRYARYSEATHFCASCHQFAAVTIDCFQCHADRPEEAIRKMIRPGETALQKIRENLPSDAIHSY